MPQTSLWQPVLDEGQVVGGRGRGRGRGWDALGNEHTRPNKIL